MLSDHFITYVFYYVELIELKPNSKKYQSILNKMNLIPWHSFTEEEQLKIYLISFHKKVYHA